MGALIDTRMVGAAVTPRRRDHHLATEGPIDALLDERFGRLARQMNGCARRRPFGYVRAWPGLPAFSLRIRRIIGYVRAARPAYDSAFRAGGSRAVGTSWMEMGAGPPAWAKRERGAGAVCLIYGLASRESRGRGRLVEDWNRRPIDARCAGTWHQTFEEGRRPKARSHEVLDKASWCCWGARSAWLHARGRAGRRQTGGQGARSAWRPSRSASRAAARQARSRAIASSGSVVTELDGDEGIDAKWRADLAIDQRRRARRAPSAPEATPQRALAEAARGRSGGRVARKGIESDARSIRQHGLERARSMRRGGTGPRRRRRARATR